MSFRLAVLASGSSGNSTWLDNGDFGLLIDAGLGPRQLGARLTAAGGSWDRIQAVILTHTHGDHWRERTLGHLGKRQIPFYCHAEHEALLRSVSPAFADLASAGLTRGYARHDDLWLTPKLRCRPIELSHDSVPTFGFRFDGTAGHAAPPWAVGYASDLGCWSAGLAGLLGNVDVLALEFNHDEMLERNSRRPPELVNRVLGDYGHLSNDQAAQLLSEIVERSEAKLPRHVVQLHLSRECNRADLARQAAHAAIGHLCDGPIVHTSVQDRVGPVLTLDAQHEPGRPHILDGPRIPPTAQPCLPGMD